MITWLVGIWVKLRVEMWKVGRSRQMPKPWGVFFFSDCSSVSGWFWKGGLYFNVMKHTGFPLQKGSFSWGAPFPSLFQESVSLLFTSCQEKQQSKCYLCWKDKRLSWKRTQCTSLPSLDAFNSRHRYGWMFTTCKVDSHALHHGSPSNTLWDVSDHPHFTERKN